MFLHNSSKTISIRTESELLQHLKYRIQDSYGAFDLWHNDSRTLALLINGNFSYLHIFLEKDSDHPGYQPADMTPEGTPENLHFLNTDGTEAGAFDIPADCLVSTTIAIKAAIEFYNGEEFPDSIKWFELKKL